VLRRLLFAFPLAAVLALVATLLATPASAEAGAPPNSMASMGDSITRGFNACGWYVDCTSRSWSTGDDSYVNSHRLRIARINSNFRDQYNLAVSGAKAADMDRQANAAADRQVQYVTIEIGANDACTSTESTMTPVATFRQQIDAALGTLGSRLPDARVFVASIPNIKRLWSIAKDNATARTYWSWFGICQSMLANPTSTAEADVQRRERVLQRVVGFNNQLAEACAAYNLAYKANCKFDDNAVFNYQFVLSQVSAWDYFHPNRAGQRKFAEITWLYAKTGFGWS
jgi:lysophospholipase L1-like esterase